MEQQIQIVHRHQEIIHSQQDEPLLDFPDVPIFPPVPNPYASLIPAELATFVIGPSHPPAAYDNNDVEEEANDEEETKDDE
jgi:hypothetical protein